jgi:hypothetical protein
VFSVFCLVHDDQKGLQINFAGDRRDNGFSQGVGAGATGTRTRGPSPRAGRTDAQPGWNRGNACSRKAATKASLTEGEKDASLNLYKNNKIHLGWFCGRASGGERESAISGKAGGLAKAERPKAAWPCGR